MNRIFLCVIALVLMANCIYAGGGHSELFPQGLVDAQKQPVSIDDLDGKFVGIYFSAQWCPPCRNFTPKLVSFRNGNNDEFEVVFVSSDRDEAAKYKYMADYNMPWPAMQWRSKAAEALKQKFEVKGIPALVIISPAGKLITSSGRSDVESNPEKAVENWKKAAGDR